MWWTAPIALALAANPHLDEARRLYEQLRYPDAVARLRVALKAPNNSPEELFSIDDLLARALIAEGKPAEAEKIYTELLVDQPDAPDPTDASPKIRDVFLKAKRSIYGDDYVKLEKGPSPPELLEATLIDPWHRVKALVLECNGVTTHLKTARHVSAKLTRGPDQWVRCSLQAEDGAGESMSSSFSWSSGPQVVLDDSAEHVPTEVAETGPRRWPAYLLGGVAVGAVVAGTVLAVLSSMDYSQVTPSTDAATTLMLDDRSRTKAGAAYGVFAGALLAAIATVVVVLRW